MKLVIVESPTKAKKLTSYLGSGFQVEASMGHIRDLPKSSLGVDLDQDFEPQYEVSADKTKVVNKLLSLAKKSDGIILATDPDREGEAIAWHLQYLLANGRTGKPENGKVAKSKSQSGKFVRAVFHEITKNAVLDAISHPGKVNMDLVDAQQARRVLDRLVGYQLSPVLWKKIRRGLSAGRVQSVALRLIVEREKEIAAFKPEEYWEVDVLLSVIPSENEGSKKTESLRARELESLKANKNQIIARLISINDKKYEPTKKGDVDGVVKDLPDLNYVVKDVEKKERRRSSLPPFTTSTLQQAAANRLGMTSKQTMRLAQNLYEEGLITYHRTDSVNLSTQALNMARKYIETQFGPQYLPEKPRYFANKAKNAQEAHEAIRTTSVKGSADIKGSARLTDRHWQLYDLILHRFLASQMNESVYDQTTITIIGQKSNKEYLFRVTGSVLKFDGWMKLFQQKEDILLPDVMVEEKLDYINHQAVQKFTEPPARYNDASLVKELEKRGIGRPSTYASIISVIEDRGYVTRDQRRFIASGVGMTVSDFLVKHFKDIVDYDFTAEMEEDLDRIARGEKEWKKIIAVFYKPFAKTIKDTEKNAERVQVPVEKTGEKCPECSKGEVVIREGRFGKFKSCSNFPECKYTENIVEKLEGQKCPLCSEGEIIVKNTRWGKPFFGCGRYPECDWASWKKPEPGLKLSKAEWERMQKAREERKAKKMQNKSSKATKRQSKKAKKK